MLAYQSEGRGKTLVLLHGFPLSSSMWDRERKEIGQYMRVVTPDLPGFGMSPRQKVPSISGMAKEVANLLDHLKIQEPVVLGGFSMGGYVAFEFFRNFPERVRGMMLLSTRSTADTADECATRFRTISDIRKYGFPVFAQKLREKILGKTTLESRHSVVEKTMSLMLASKPEGVKDALVAMAERRDFTHLLSLIQSPTLIMAGEEDALIQSSEGQAIHEKIHASEFYSISKAGHLLNLECPEIFRDRVENFLAISVLERFGVAA